MEKIKVNMSPNPLDVQTIHASQNDTEARQWEFELHNNGELIDTSEVTEQLVFKAYKGGTEQLLPENGSTPTTSPFKGDIKYPQGLLTDQEFTYRQSPTIQDGLARFDKIKGNTLVWNQLISEQYSHTFTASGSNQNVNIERIDNIVPGHKYLYAITQANSMSSNVRNTLQYLYSNGSNVTVSESNATNHNLNAGRYGWIFTAPTDNANKWISLYYWCHTPNVAVTIKDAILVDLTLMFGAGNEPVTADELLSLFNLPYYDFNQGSLLSFNGNGIKTVGKNRLPKAVEGRYTGNGITCVVDEDGTITFSGTATATGNAVIIPLETPYKIQENTYLHLRNDVANLNVAPSFENATNPGGGISRPLAPVNAMIAIGQKADYEITRIRLYITNGSSTNVSIKPMVTFSETESEYEPYTSSTLSLPISTYFPTGMKSTGSYYDELTLTKAITRMGAITFDGTQTPVINTITSTQCRAFYNVSDVLPVTRDSQVIEQDLISNYLPCNSNYNTNLGAEGIHRRIGGQTEICVSLGLNRGITTWDEFKAYLSAHPLTVYYPLATPTETSFTTASLVTENAEIPLSNEDGILIGKCTEQLSENPGFIDAKIKLADSDGECYSNKIQLHIERSPQ